jgi:hypothetical protein
MSDHPGHHDAAKIISNTVSSPLVQNTRVHINVTQEVIVVTEDKVRLCLHNHLVRLEARNRWIAPAGILLTIVVAFATTTFRDFVLPASTWQAVFFLFGLFSFGWLIKALLNARGAPTLEDVLGELKRVQVKETTDVVVTSPRNQNG